jgi:tetratricopeptide (TPR) repeat protein
VSFTKGCYLGQETVAKLASHRGAAYQPVLLRLDDGVDDPDATVGASFAAGERKRAGTVLSAATWGESVYLQVRLWRELRVAGLVIDCRFEDGKEIRGTVVPLPLLKTPSSQELAEDLYLRATELFSSDRENDAIVLLERALAVCPTHADSYESLGVILGRHGRFEEAIALMCRLLEVDPDSVMAHTNMSVYHNQLGRIEEAEREARAAAAKSLERSRRAAADADSERRQRDQAAADRARREEMFRQVLAIDPDDILASFGLGQMMVEAGDPAAAVPLLERAIAGDRGYSAAYLALGRAFEGLGERERARATYSDGVRVAARKGDMKTANTMQERLAALEVPESATD